MATMNLTHTGRTNKSAAHKTRRETAFVNSCSQGFEGFSASAGNLILIFRLVGGVDPAHIVATA